MRARSALILSFVVSCVTSAFAETVFFDDFSRPDGEVDGWTSFYGDWRIEEEALVVKSSSFRDPEMPYVWIGDPELSLDRSFEASLKFEFTAQTSNTAAYQGGIMFCAQAPSRRRATSGYTIEWLHAPPAPIWRICRMDSGRYGDCVEVPSDDSMPSDWSLEVTEDRIIFSAGGVEHINYRDSTYRGGYFGAWVFGTGGAVRIDDVRITTSIEVPDVCDTHCLGLDLELIPGLSSLVRATAIAEDDTEDPILYRFAARRGAAQVGEIGPQESSVAEFDLPPGDYTVSVTVSDGSECDPPAEDASHEVSISVPVKPAFRRGDCNDDGTVDISDPIFTLASLFLGEGDRGCDDACDANDDGATDISDPIAALGALYLGSGIIPLPGRLECGADPTEDQLSCGEYKSCP